MLKILILSLALMLASTNSQANEAPPQQIVQRHMLSDKALNAQIHFDVYLPTAYDKTKQYPVVYVLDGMRYGQLAAGAQAALSHFERMPQAITVGVYLYESHTRRQMMTRLDKPFMAFMVGKLLPYIDKTYSTNKSRAVFGWQTAGGLVLKLLANYPDKFNAYLSASPNSPGRADDPTELLKTYKSHKLAGDKFLYLAMADSEHWIAKPIEALTEYVNKVDQSPLAVELDVYSKEDHWSTPHLTIYRGLRAYYRQYEPITFTSLQALKEAGGLPYVKRYYASRAKRFGLENRIGDKTRFSMLLQALRGDDIKLFDSYMVEFSDYIEQTKQPGIGSMYGNFYLKYKMPEKALRLFTVNARRFADEPFVYYDKAIALQALNKSEQARPLLEKAVKLAEKLNDDELEGFRKALQQL